MASEGSITHCIQLLKGGEWVAAQQLWERYFQRVVGLARVQLRNAPRRAADEEDVALSAFESFYQRAERGLVLSDLAGPGLEQILDPEPTPELAAQMTEECRRLYACLGDDTLRAVARWKFDGDDKLDLAAATTSSIAVLLGNGNGTFKKLSENCHKTLNFQGFRYPKRRFRIVSKDPVQFVTPFGADDYPALGTLPVNAGPSSLVSRDFNGDGRSDLAAANFGSYEISVLLLTGAQ